MSVEWNGNMYSTSGIYVDTLQTLSGCDSIVMMDLTINNSVFTFDSTVACDSVEWNGNIFISSGVYVDTLQTVNGCDSVVSLHILINYSQYDTIVVSSCNSYYWDGNIIIIQEFTHIIIYPI